MHIWKRNSPSPSGRRRFAQDPTGVGRSLIPVRVSLCQPKGLLQALTYIDLAGIDDEGQAVLKLLHGVRDGRDKPLVRPLFPPRSKDVSAPGWKRMES